MQLLKLNELNELAATDKFYQDINGLSISERNTKQGENFESNKGAVYEINDGEDILVLHLADSPYASEDQIQPLAIARLLQHHLESHGSDFDMDGTLIALGKVVNNLATLNGLRSINMHESSNVNTLRNQHLRDDKSLSRSGRHNATVFNEEYRLSEV